MINNPDYGHFASRGVFLTARKDAPYIMDSGEKTIRLWFKYFSILNKEEKGK